MHVLVKLFLQHYKEKKLDINYKDKYGYTPLHVACLCNVKVEIMEQLLSHPNIDVDCVNADGNSPLHYFCKCFLSPSCQEIAAKLIHLGADPNKQNKVHTMLQEDLTFRGHTTLYHHL
jgi:ankyrin repeat protein